MLSLNLDFTSVWATVNSILPNLWLVFAVPLGISFAFGILDKILSAVKSSLGRG